MAGKKVKTYDATLGQVFSLWLVVGLVIVLVAFCLIGVITLAVGKIGHLTHRQEVNTFAALVAITGIAVLIRYRKAILCTKSEK